MVLDACLWSALLTNMNVKVKVSISISISIVRCKV